MSRPYININSASYNSTTDVITFDVTALRLRGETSLTVAGFTESRTISLTDGRFLTEDSGNFTFSANVNGTSSNNLTGANGVAPTFSPATATFTFGGTATGGSGALLAHATNVKIQVWGSHGTGSVTASNWNIFGPFGYTFSATQSAETAVATLAANIVALPTGATATTSGNSLIIQAPASTGAYYNNQIAKILPSGSGTPSNAWTHSTAYYSGTWSGGVTTITVPVSATNFGQLESFVFNLS
jgi:hypothetical protein